LPPSRSSSPWSRCSRRTSPRDARRASIRSWRCGRNDGMPMLRRLLSRLRHSVWPGRTSVDAAREIAAHLQMLEEELACRGMSRDDARAEARRRFGSAALTADQHRDARAFAWVDDLRWDIRYSARLLMRNPAFALTAILSLAIGIGANTTVFTVAHALLFRDP